VSKYNAVTAKVTTCKQKIEFREAEAAKKSAEIDNFNIKIQVNGGALSASSLAASNTWYKLRCLYHCINTTDPNTNSRISSWAAGGSSLVQEVVMYPKNIMCISQSRGACCVCYF
jgi:hypothetical protein